MQQTVYLDCRQMSICWRGFAPTGVTASPLSYQVPSTYLIFLFQLYASCVSWAWCVALANATWVEWTTSSRLCWLWLEEYIWILDWTIVNWVALWVMWGRRMCGIRNTRIGCSVASRLILSFWVPIVSWTMLCQCRTLSRAQIFK